MVPIQIINSRDLSVDDNLWLKGLDNRLDTSGLRRVLDAAVGLAKGDAVQTYLDIVSRANAERIKEVLTMGEFEKILEETGYIARAEARGETHGITKGINAVLNLVRQGLSADQIEQRLRLEGQIA